MAHDLRAGLRTLATVQHVVADFDGDGKTDLSTYRPGSSLWNIKGLAGTYFGGRGDIPVPGDYNGDGKTDIATFRPSTGFWSIKGQAGSYYGLAGDIPVPGDYNGDGKTDISTFRPSKAYWSIKGQPGAYFGARGDIPVSGDYNGDGTTDIATFRPSKAYWSIKGEPGVYFGAAGDIPVPADYNGDGTTDIAVYTRSTGFWSIRGQSSTAWGALGDIPLPLPVAVYDAYFRVPQWRYGYSNSQYTATAVADGNNVMDVGSKSAADATPAGTVGLVWIGDYDNARCSWEVSNSQLYQIVQSGIGDPKILGYFFSDEPDPYACPNSVSDHKARNALIKSIDPSKITFIVVDSNSGQQTLGQIPLWKGAADYIGYDPYPCHTGAACDYSWIDQVIAAADASGNPYWLIVQAFASASWRWPTPDEESHMLQQMAKSQMAGIGAFSWNWNNDSLVNHPDVRRVIANNMLGKDYVTPSRPTALTGSAVGLSSVTLAWTAATDDTAIGSYRLYRNGTQVDTTSALSYQFSGLSCGTTSSLGVAAVDTSGNVGPTATLSAATIPCNVIVSAGDICGSATDCAPTANLIGSINPTAVLPLGDNAYNSGTTTEYANYYDPNWGKYKSITYPTPGNHEYNTAGAAGYFAYFNNPQPYYSYDIGAWHLISLNGDISSASGSAQETWLKNDLATHANVCTLAYWHEPRWSSDTTHGDSTSYGTIWTDLYNGGADVVLNGHAHDYERFAPQNPGGNLDTARGIREFVVGTGGASHYAFKSTIDPNSEIHDNTSFGVLKLTLHPTGYDWQFVPVAGAIFSDAGSGNCH